jgi:protein-disulfide isomerase
MASRVEQKRAARAERIAYDEAREQAERRRRRLGWAVAAFLVVLAVSVVAGVALGGKNGDGGKPADAREVSALFAGIPQHGTTLGSPRAPVTLTEFADLQCPFCAQYARDALPTIVRRYVRTGKVRLDFRILSFIGPDSVKAGRMTAAAGRQNRLWNFIELFYRNQGEENTGYVTDSFFRRLAGSIPGFEVGRALSERTSPSVATQLASDRDRATGLGIQSTPSFLVGRRGKPARPLQVTQLDAQAFAPKLDQALRGR